MPARLLGRSALSDSLGFCNRRALHKVTNISIFVTPLHQSEFPIKLLRMLDLIWQRLSAERLWRVLANGSNAQSGLTRSPHLSTPPENVNQNQS